MIPVHRRPPSTGVLPPVLVFDFDGVLCDSLEECMMVAWYAHAGAPVLRLPRPRPGGRAAEVVERFERCRPFMRHLPHFLVPLVGADSPATRAAFRPATRRSPRAETERFAEAADGLPRASCARRTPSDWSRATPSSGVWRARRTAPTSRPPATARPSVRSCAHTAWRSTTTTSSARCATSARRWTQIATRESRDPADVVLVDDSIENCIAARAAGFGASGRHGGTTPRVMRRLLEDTGFRP